MYYEILVNGSRLGVYGHPRIKNMHLSLQVTEEGPEVFASGVCEEPDGLYLVNWTQHRIVWTDNVTMQPTVDTAAATPIRRYRMRPES